MSVTPSASRPTSDLPSDTAEAALELGRVETSHLINDVITSLSWRNLNITVKDRETGQPRSILTNAQGCVRAGEMLAIMGPSGSGKTTLLNALAFRQAAAGSHTEGEILANGQQMDRKWIRKFSGYVEQDDALMGSLTVRETMTFAAGLALPNTVSKAERVRRVDDLISNFGLRAQAHTIVGTPLQKGLSGGQKKRLGVASRLITEPRILFLDEPTSGLDSTLAYEVISLIRSIAKKNHLVVIASIHQPATSTFKLFDKLCLLSRGQTCYFGDRSSAPSHFNDIGHSMPAEINPAEFYIDLVNTDLAMEGDETYRRTEQIIAAWAGSVMGNNLSDEVENECLAEKTTIDLSSLKTESPSRWMVPWTLMRRSWVKAYRDLMVYYIRVAMYLGLAILMGTVFLRFSNDQRYIQPYINAIFFGSAFMSFMAVAYVPAFLEDLATFTKERANGLVGPLAFMTTNFIIGLPFLFVITVLFSVFAYFMMGFRMDGTAFMKYVMWLFLDLVAAESLVVLVSAIFPIFVLALAVTAFANGLWMCVDGFLVPMNVLNVFWKYVFHYIDYQAYVFQGMMVNEFEARTYKCAEVGGQVQCQYASELNAQGEIAGKAVLEALDIATGKEGQWVGILIASIVVYRVLGYLALLWKK